MANVNKTSLKSTISDLTELLKEGRDLAADLVFDTESKEVYPVYFSPSIYDHPKCRMPARVESTETRRFLCTVRHENIKDGIDVDGEHYKVNQTDLMKLIGKVLL